MTDKVTNADTLLERLRIAGARIRILTTELGDGQVLIRAVSLVEPLGPLEAYTDVHIGAYKALAKRGVLAFAASTAWPIEHGKDEIRYEQFATLKPEPEVAHDPAAILIDGIAISAIPAGADDSVEEDDEGMVIISVIVKGVSTPLARFPMDGHVKGVFSPDDIRAAIAREHGGSAALTREPVKSRQRRSKKAPPRVVEATPALLIGGIDGETVAHVPGNTGVMVGGVSIGSADPKAIEAAKTADDAFGSFLP